jgi:DNA repair protein RadC
MSIKLLPPASRPRERLVAAGAESLSDVELVATVMGGAYGLAAELVARFGGAAGLGRALVAELRAMPGVGLARACQLRAALELGARAADAEPAEGLVVRNAELAHDLLRPLARRDVEELHVLALDGRHRLRARFMAARGRLNVVQVSPRDLFGRLLRERAVAAIVAHNHPSGDPSPSPEDVALTERLKLAGEVLGVALVDHLVITRSACFSFERGRFLGAPPPKQGGEL